MRQEEAGTRATTAAASSGHTRAATTSNAAAYAGAAVTAFAQRAGSVQPEDAGTAERGEAARRRVLRARQLRPHRRGTGRAAEGFGVDAQVDHHEGDRGGALRQPRHREYNLALGERRASAVKAYLAGLGVGAERILILSKGKEAPICTDENESCWSQNRRGHFIITAK